MTTDEVRVKFSTDFRIGPDTHDTNGKCIGIQAIRIEKHNHKRDCMNATGRLIDVETNSPLCSHTFKFDDLIHHLKSKSPSDPLCISCHKEQEDRDPEDDIFSNNLFCSHPLVSGKNSPDKFTLTLGKNNVMGMAISQMNLKLPSAMELLDSCRDKELKERIGRIKDLSRHSMIFCHVDSGDAHKIIDESQIFAFCIYALPSVLLTKRDMMKDFKKLIKRDGWDPRFELGFQYFDKNGNEIQLQPGQLDSDIIAKGGYVKTVDQTKKIKLWYNTLSSEAARLYESQETKGIRVKDVKERLEASLRSIVDEAGFDLEKVAESIISYADTYPEREFLLRQGEKESSDYILRADIEGICIRGEYGVSSDKEMIKGLLRFIRKSMEVVKGKVDTGGRSYVRGYITLEESESIRKGNLEALGFTYAASGKKDSSGNYKRTWTSPDMFSAEGRQLKID